MPVFFRAGHSITTPRVNTEKNGHRATPSRRTITSPPDEVEISDSVRFLLTMLAQREGLSLQSALETAVKSYDRTSFFDHLNREYTRLRADPEAWREEEEERRLLEGTL